METFTIYDQLGAVLILPTLAMLYGALSQGVSVILYILVVIFARALQARRFSLIYLPVLLLPLSFTGMLIGCKLKQYFE